jgi:hypothetical protein
MPMGLFNGWEDDNWGDDGGYRGRFFRRLFGIHRRGQETTGPPSWTGQSLPSHDLRQRQDPPQQLQWGPGRGDLGPWPARRSDRGGWEW